MARAFTRKRKPDSPSMSMSLEEHIASTDRNPHPQYVTFGDLGAAQSGVSIEYDRANLSNHQNQTTTVVPNAYLANILNQAIVSNTSRMTRHIAKITQEDVLNNGLNPDVTLPHIDTTGLSLYSARTHTHTLGDLGAAAWDHNHDDRYAKLVHSHNYADKDHSHDNYVTYGELKNTGMYPDSVNVAANAINESISDTEGGDSTDQYPSYDCNNFLIQGNYYLKPVGTDDIINGPVGEHFGLLTVYVSSVEDRSITDTVQFFYGEISWKRAIHIETVPVTTTDSETGEEITSYETIETFGEWLPLVETLPIGSLMFLNKDGGAPSGYIEANGAQVGSSAYPVLWKFARQCGVCVLSTNEDYLAGKLDGYYALIYHDAIDTKAISAEDIGCIVIDDDDIVRELMESNQETYIGRSLRYIPKENIETVDFRIPNFGDNYYLQMCAYGNYAGTNFGVSTQAGLPNITGEISATSAATACEVFGEIHESQVLTEGALGVLIGEQMPTADGTGFLPGPMVRGITIDASKSNDIFGSSDTVTPKNVSVRVFIKAYNGTIIKSDVAEADIRTIISDLLTQFGYATTTSNGLVRLATREQVDAGINDETVITPALMNHATANFISTIKESGGKDLPVADHAVTLPSFAYKKGNNTVALDATAISCTAIVDIEEPTNLYHDFVVPYETAYSAYIENNSSVTNMLDVAIADVVLKCVSASNAMGYPAGAVIPKPLCSYKSDSEAEYMAHPTVTMFVDPNEQYTENNAFNKVKVRLYWPLMWYFKKFTPEANDGSRSFPFIDMDEGSTPTIEQIEAECAFWNVLVNVRM